MCSQELFYAWKSADDWYWNQTGTCPRIPSVRLSRTLLEDWATSAGSSSTTTRWTTHPSMLWTVCQIFSGCNFLLIDYLRELMGGDGRDGTTLYIYASISYLYSFDCLFVCVCRDLSNNNLRLGNHSFSSWIHLRELWVLVLCLGRKENRKIIGFYLYPAVCNGALYLPLFHC